MKVLLIRPNSMERSCPIPLGLGYIASALRQERGDHIRIVDARRFRLSGSRLGRIIRDFTPDVVGISALTMDSVNAHECAALARANAPAAHIVLGGPHVSASRENVLEDPNIDVGVVGEGEKTVVELFDAIDGGGDFGRVAGIVFRDQKEPRFTGPRKLIQDIDSLSPAWDLLNPRAYFISFGAHMQNKTSKHRQGLSIFTSRGCPYHCIYCHNVFGKKFRACSPDSVINEMTMLKDRYGVREIEILDDCFNLSKKRAMDICTGIVDNDLNLAISLPNGIRGDIMDEEMFDLFKEAGIFRLSFAVESANPRVQTLIKKNLDLDKIKEAMHMAVKRKILSLGFFMMGFPTETYEEMLITAEYAARTPLHLAMFFYLHPFPGTEVAKMTGVDASHMDFNSLFTMPINLSAASNKQLHHASKYAYRKFYLNPKRIASTLRVIPKNRFILNSLPGLSLLFKDMASF